MFTKKKLRSVKNVNQCTILRKNILNCDIALKNHYSVRKQKEKSDILEKAKINKKVLYQHVKKKQNSKCEIGPFAKKRTNNF